MNLNKWDGRTPTRLIWLRIGPSGELLCARQCTFWFCNMWGIFDSLRIWWLINKGSASAVSDVIDCVTIGHSCSKQFPCFFYEKRLLRPAHVSWCVFTLALFCEGNRMEVGETDYSWRPLAFDEINKSSVDCFTGPTVLLRACCWLLWRNVHERYRVSGHAHWTLA